MEIYNENHIRHKKSIKIQAGVRKIRLKGFSVKPRRKYLHRIKTDLKETICKSVDWIELFREIENSWDLVSFGSIQDGEIFVY
jgi:hypothetical protein